MKKTKDEISKKQQRFFENEILNNIVIDMYKEFKRNYDMYIEGSYASLYNLAKKVLHGIAQDDLRDDYVKYISNKFIPGIEDLFKYCDGCEQYISVDSEWSDNDFITSGGEYNICQDCVENGYGK